MNKTLILIFVVCATLALAPTKASAGSGITTAAGAAIGYVDFNRAINEVSDGKKAKQRLKNEFQEKQEQLDRLQTQLKEMKDSLDRDRILLASDSLVEREQQYRQKYADLNQKLANFTTEMQKREEVITKDIIDKLKSIVKDVGRSEGYSLILEKSQDVVLYAPDGNDLTDRVIQAYDQGSRGKKK